MVFLALIISAVLSVLRFYSAAQIRADLPPGYGDLTVHTIGVALFVAVAVFLDALLRALVWRGYMRNRRGRPIPALIEDIVTVALVLFAASLGLYFEEGLSIAGFLTASGATAVILGFALQSAIQDLFSGLAINLDGSFVIGDWLTYHSDQVKETMYGRVSGISWRTTFLTMEDGRVLMLPNHLMTSQPVVNHSRPYGPKRYEVQLVADNRIPVRRIEDALLGEAFKVVSGPGYARHPEPYVHMKQIGENGCVYDVHFFAWPDKISASNSTSKMLMAMHHVLLVNDLASPVQQVELTEKPDLDFAAGEKETRAALSRAPLFSAALNMQQIAELAERCQVLELPKGAILMRQGDPPGPMYIILQGAISIAIAAAEGTLHEVAVSAVGDAVGEMSLMTGAPRTATATVLAPLRVLEISKAAIEVLLEEQPTLANRFAEILDRRQHELDEAAGRAAQVSRQTDILARISAFFSQALSGKV